MSASAHELEDLKRLLRDDSSRLFTRFLNLAQPQTGEFLEFIDRKLEEAREPGADLEVNKVSGAASNDTGWRSRQAGQSSSEVRVGDSVTPSGEGERQPQGESGGGPFNPTPKTTPDPESGPSRTRFNPSNDPSPRPDSRAEAERQCSQLKLDTLGPLVTCPDSDRAEDRWSGLVGYLKQVERLKAGGFDWETFRDLSKEFYLGAYKYWSEEGHRPSVEQINLAAFDLARFFTRAAIEGGGADTDSLQIAHYALGDHMERDECSASGGYPLGRPYWQKGKSGKVTPLGFRVQGSTDGNSKATVLDYFYSGYFAPES